MPFRAAARASFLELEPSAGTHLPPTITHVSAVYPQTLLSPRVTLGRKRYQAHRSKRVQQGTEMTIVGMRSAAASGGTSLLLVYDTTHCLHRLWARPADDPPPTTQPLPTDHIATDSSFAVRFHSEDRRICGSQTKLSNQKANQKQLLRS